jgi:hypothetical protein
VEDQVVKKLEQFNSVCDELYKEIVRCGLLPLDLGRGVWVLTLWVSVAGCYLLQLRRKEKMLNLMEKSPKNVDLHRQIQTAGNLAQVVGDFRYFLETGNNVASTQPPPQQPKE